MKTQVPVTVTYKRTIVEEHSIQVSVEIDLREKPDLAAMKKSAQETAKEIVNIGAEPGASFTEFKAVLEDKAEPVPSADAAAR